MELRHLETFERIVALGSQAAAASALGHAPSTVTLHVQELERHLGAPLFVRLGRRLQLTSLGESVLRCAAGVAQSVADLRKAAAAAPAVEAGILVVGAVEPAATTRLVPLIADLFADRPRVQMEIVVGGATALRDLVVAGDLPFALTTGAEPSSEVAFEPLFAEPVAIAMARDHALAGTGDAMIEDLTDVPLLLTEPACAYRNAISDALRARGIHPYVRAEIRSSVALAQAAQLGLGVAVAPRLFFDTSALCVRRVRGVDVQIGVLRRHDAILNALEQEVLTSLVATARSSTVDPDLT